MKRLIKYHSNGRISRTCNMNKDGYIEGLVRYWDSEGIEADADFIVVDHKFTASDFWDDKAMESKIKPENPDMLTSISQPSPPTLHDADYLERMLSERI